MKKRVLTAMILAASAMISCLPVCAQEYTADGTGECRVSATVNSSYSVKVPAVLELQYNSVSGKYEAAYTVSAKGNILPSQSVTVRPTSNSFTLIGSFTGETSQAAITREITEWIHAGRQTGEAAYQRRGVYGCGRNGICTTCRGGYLHRGIYLRLCTGRLHGIRAQGQEGCP